MNKKIFNEEYSPILVMRNWVTMYDKINYGKKLTEGDRSVLLCLIEEKVQNLFNKSNEEENKNGN